MVERMHEPILRDMYPRIVVVFHYISWTEFFVKFASLIWQQKNLITRFTDVLFVPFGQVWRENFRGKLHGKYSLSMMPGDVWNWKDLKIFSLWEFIDSLIGWLYILFAFDDASFCFKWLFCLESINCGMSLVF